MKIKNAELHYNSESSRAAANSSSTKPSFFTQQLKRSAVPFYVAKQNTNFSTNIATIQGQFILSNNKNKVYATDYEENNAQVKVFKKGGDFTVNFIRYCANKLGEKNKRLSEPNIRKILIESYNYDEDVSIGDIANFSSLADAFVHWLFKRIDEIERSDKKRKKDEESDDDDKEQTEDDEKKEAHESRPNKKSKIKNLVFWEEQEDDKQRTVWMPKPVKGDPSDEKGREVKKLGDRRFSFTEGMLHIPQFAYGGIGVSEYTQVNDRGTYSIGAYTVDNKSHLIGGSKSGESYGNSENKKEMHAEEQQIAAFEKQIEMNTYNLKDRLEHDTVLLHLHISKSPCSERCQSIFDNILNKYPRLQIQMYLEIPYKANDPSEMIKEAKKLKSLIEKYKDRLAYQIVSVHHAKSMLKKDNNPVSSLGELGQFIYENVKKQDNNPSLALTRREKFEGLIEKGNLPKEGKVSSLK